MKSARSAPLFVLACACAPVAASPIASPRPVVLAAPEPPASSSAAPFPDESFRARPPEAQEAKPFEVPSTVPLQLKNGIPVVVAPFASPNVAVCVVARGGLSDVGPEGVEVLGMMTRAMPRGTTTRSMGSLQDAYASLFMPSPVLIWWADAVVLSATAPADKLHELVDLVADISLHPSFEAKEFERVRGQHATWSDRDSRDGSVVAPRVLRGAVFGGHPYGAVEGSGQRERGVTRAQVVALHGRVFDPSRMSIVVVGATTQDEVVAALEDGFGSLHSRGAGRSVPGAPPTPDSPRPRLVVVDSPGAAVATIAEGVSGPGVGAADGEAATVALEVLADWAQGRITRRLREDLGLVSGLSVSWYRARAGGILGWNTRAATARVASVLAETDREVRAFASQGPTEEQVAWARDREVLSFASSFETATSAAGVFAWASATSRSADDVARTPARFSAVTADAVRSAAARYLDGDRIRTVVVGDWAALRTSLTALGWGRIEVRDASFRLAPQGGPGAAR